MAKGVGKEAGEAQSALVKIRTQHSDLCAEQEKIRFMKQEYIAQLKAAEDSQENMRQSTQLRRFMGQLDLTTRAITEQMAELQRQQQIAATRFRELNKERIKFETLAIRAKDQLKQMTQKKEQKELDFLNNQRFTAQRKERQSR